MAAAGNLAANGGEGCGGGAMNVCTYSEARQRLAHLLDKAAAEGEVRIK